jgi:hypothetical protein
VVSREDHGGKACPGLREPVQGERQCNEHTCSAHPASCGAEHVRCTVKMLEHHRSNKLVRADLSTCGHSAIEETNTCWFGDTCKTCRHAHSNNDSCNREACHDADTQGERDMQDKLEADYSACLRGSEDATNVHRREMNLPPIACHNNFPTLEVTHDRKNMEQLGNFRCTKDANGSTCSCKCNRHPPCCAKRNMLLAGNTKVFGNRFTGVAKMQDCCNMCTNHPSCTAWEYTSEQVCELKSGMVSAGSFTANPLPGMATTWAGVPSNVGTC